MGKQWTQWQTIFLDSKITVGSNFSHEIKRHLLLGRKVITNLDSILKSTDITLLIEICIVKAMVFFSNHVWMWELDHKEGWVPQNWCFWTVVLEKTLESPLDCKDIKRFPWSPYKDWLVNPKGNQSWMFIGRTDAEAETPILWPPNAKSQLIGKDPDARKDWRQEDKGMTEDEMAGWHHWFNGHECEQAPGDGERQGSLACCHPWDRKYSDTTERLNSYIQNSILTSFPGTPVIILL